MYESTAFDDENGEPVVVLVVSGQHDVSRLVNLFNGGLVLVEQLKLGVRLRRQVARRNGGRGALALLKQHGGPDFTHDGPDALTEWIDPSDGTRYDLSHPWLDRDDEPWVPCGWLRSTDGITSVPLMRLAGDERDFADILRAQTYLPNIIKRYGPLRPPAHAEHKAAV